ncbi:uncharacterized protein CBL_02125 [Carabus blaptoides fortunei]
MAKDKLFDTLKNERPGILEKKVVPLEGDAAELNLGMSEEDRSIVKESVSVIYHVAASVRFDDHLKKAILLNTRGTRELAQLALETRHLAVLVHVSTTYCNCVVGTEIGEQFYPPPTDWREAITVAEQFDEAQLAYLTSMYLGAYPNTYTFTKALGEHVIKDMCEGRIPTIVVRPSIVISTYKDPVEGWIDNFNGPVGLLVACGKGLLRMTYLDKDIIADYIPVDLVGKIIIISSWDLALRQNREQVEVMHASSNYHLWSTIGEIINMGREISREIPMNDMIWVPKGSVTKCKYFAYFNTIFFHLLPALFLDCFIKLSGNKPILGRLQTKIFNASFILRYFTFQAWQFAHDKMFDLLERIEETDKSNWNYDYRSADVEIYFRNCMIGTRRYLLNEPDNTLPAARVHYRRMYWLDKVTMFFYWSFIVWAVYKLDIINVVCGVTRVTLVNLQLEVSSLHAGSLTKRVW